jgi:hypothetical protein
MNVDVVAVKYVGKDKMGDFSWMVLQPQYKDVVFLYCDVDDCLFSLDIYGLRGHKDKTCHIPICSKEDGCFSCLNMYNKMIINAAFDRLRNHILEKDVKMIFYSFEDKNMKQTIRYSDEHPFVDESVIEYIMEKIKILSSRPLKIMAPKKI